MSFQRGNLLGAGFILTFLRHERHSSQTNAGHLLVFFLRIFPLRVFVLRVFVLLVFDLHAFGTYQDLQVLLQDGSK